MPRENCKDEFKLSNFGLDYPKPYLFVTSQWPCPPIIYLVYRLLSMAFFVTLIVMSGAWDYEWYTSESNRIKWFIYFTDWSLAILTLSTIVQSVLVAHAQCAGKEHTPLNSELDVFAPLPWYLKVSWVLYNISVHSAFAVTLIYWVGVYKGAHVEGRPVHVMEISEHAINSVYVTIDLFVVATPIRIYHVIHGLTFAAIYVCFTYAFTSAGGTSSFDKPYIYTVLDWRGDFYTAALTVAAVSLIVAPALWMIVYAMYSLRLLIHSALFPDLEEKSDKLEN